MNTGIQEILWSDDYENFLNGMRQNCILLSKHHKSVYERYKSLSTWFKIPVIFLSSINSVFSLCATNFISQEAVSISNSMISLICSVLVSIAMYLKIEDILEKENISARSFYMLSIDIFKTLSLTREHRMIDPKSLIEDSLARYNKLVEISCLTNLKLKDQLAPLDILLANSSNSSCKGSNNDCISLESLEKGSSSSS